ncbi:MAG: peptidylprolyl isomerase, partial [Oscillospiraceae bacterium]|nr:peptidylprolyl isomerase [Oscillospiraceae bacterium]
MGLVMMLTCLAGCGRKEVEIEEDPILNYTAPQEGEEIVVLHIKDMGDIKIKLFPELLPEACENFTTLAKEGYYDELIFHRVIEGFMIQGGD